VPASATAPEPAPSSASTSPAVLGLGISPPPPAGPVVSAALGANGSGGTSQVVVTPDHFSGLFSAIQRLDGKGSLAGILTYRPYSYFFLRGGAAYRLYDLSSPMYEDDHFSYVWGLGYDDWHPGTFSAQINNWGPIYPSHGKEAITLATLDLGYKLDFPASWARYLGVALRIDIPFDDDPGIGANLTFNPWRHIVLNLGVLVRTDGTALWTYGFGWTNWAPFTLTVMLDNWGPNNVPDHNFTTTSQLTASFSFAF
jgi:hypothetical protein